MIKNKDRKSLIGRIVTYFRAVYQLLISIFAKMLKKYPDVELDYSKPLPILTYQMGKVASRTIYESLREISGLDVFHVHRIGQDVHPNLYDRIVVLGHTATIITLVREPIARSISAFFQHLDYYCGTKNAHKKYSLDQLNRHFLSMSEHEFMTPLTWFDNEFKRVLAVDVYEYNFPYDMGYQIISTDRYRILIIRTDLKDEKKSKCICEFLGLKSLSLVQSNITSEIGRVKGKLYRQFIESVLLPGSLINKMLDSKYTRHFFSPLEISELRQKWSRGNGSGKNQDVSDLK